MRRRLIVMSVVMMAAVPVIAGCGGTRHVAAVQPLRTCPWHTTKGYVATIVTPTDVPATTPADALERALAHGDVPGGGSADAWIRLASPTPSSASFFHGHGVTPDGRPVPGAVVQGDVATFANVSAPQPGWIFVETQFHDCDPRPEASAAHAQEVPGRGTSYLLTFQHQQVAMRLVTECVADDRVTMDVTGAKAEIRFDQPPTASQWQTLTDCVGFHHGQVTPAGSINPTEFAFVQTVRQLGPADARGLSDTDLVSAGHAICRARKHPGTPVLLPEIHETMTTTTAPDGTWTWTLKPQTDRYFELISQAVSDGLCT